MFHIVFPKSKIKLASNYFIHIWLWFIYINALLISEIIAIISEIFVTVYIIINTVSFSFKFIINYSYKGKVFILIFYYVHF